MKHSILKIFRILSFTFIVSVLFSFAGCADAQVTQEELSEKHYTALQILFANAGEDWTSDDFRTACENEELFTFTENNIVYASKRAMTASPAGGSGLSYLEFWTDEATGTWGMMHYHSDFESADIYAYQSGKWLTPEMEAMVNQPVGSYIISQPDVFIDGDEVIEMTSGNAMISFLRFDTRLQAVDRLQNVHILLA